MKNYLTKIQFDFALQKNYDTFFLSIKVDKVSIACPVVEGLVKDNS